MRKYFIAGLLLLATLAPGGCIFEPRTAETPETGTDQYPWVVPNRPKDVFVNLKSGLASNRDSNYKRSLDDSTFTFIPFADAENVYPGKFAGWNASVELSVLTMIKTNYLGTRSVQFGDANLNFTYENEQVSLATYEGAYTITLNFGDSRPAEVYAGIARFEIVQGTQGWVLSKWEDIGQVAGNATSGMLRGALRP
jgi:hypothetical protein